jgi:hypothetical protein
VALASVDDVQTDIASSVQDPLGRTERSAGQRRVVAHRVDVSALAAEVDLPVDVEQCRAPEWDVAVVGVDGGRLLGAHSRRLRHANHPAVERYEDR